MDEQEQDQTDPEEQERQRLEQQKQLVSIAIVFFALLIVLVGFLLWFISSENSPIRSFESIDASDTMAAVGAVFTPVECGKVIGDCVAEVEVKIDSCVPKKAKEVIDAQLSRPLETEPCRDLELSLRASCAANCELDFSSLLVVPGKARYFLQPTADEFGSCLARGKKPVSVRGTCKTRQNILPNNSGQ
ncbi:hypothetical protein BVY02_01595 [bacterium J17]|nr:hypothetical protein BVY02_01595 [bacterium J17]